MTTQTLPAISTPSRRAVALGATITLVVAALLAGAVAGAGVAAWWQSRTVAESTSAAEVPVARTVLDPAVRLYGSRAALLESALAITGATTVVALRPALDPAVQRYGARAAQLESALAITGATTVVAVRPVLDPAVQRYGARAAQLESALAITGSTAVVRTPVDPENRFYGPTRLVRPSSPDVASPVAAAQVRTPESRFYGTRSGS